MDCHSAARRRWFGGMLAGLLLLSLAAPVSDVSAGKEPLDCTGVAAWIDDLEPLGQALAVDLDNDLGNARQLEQAAGQLEAIQTPPAAVDLQAQLGEHLVEWAAYYQTTYATVAALYEEGVYHPEGIEEALISIRSVIYGYPSTVLAITDLAVRCDVPVNVPGPPSVSAASLAAPPPCGGTDAWMPLTETFVEGFWPPVIQIHREITEGAAPGDFGQLLLRWEALNLWTFGQALALAGLPAPPATAELNRQLVEAMTLLADAWVTSRLWVTAYAMWSFASVSGSLTGELDTALTGLLLTLERDASGSLVDFDDRYQDAVADWASLADECQVESELPASPLPPPA